MRLRLDGFEWGVLLAFALLSVWLLALLLWRARVEGRIWTGGDGPYVGDQMQYLGWIRDSSQNWLISNPWRLESSPASFLHPGLLLSGLLARLGIAPAIAYLAWKPVAVVSLFAAAKRYGDRLLTGKAQRRFALVLALFYVAPAAAVARQAGIAGTDQLFLQAIVLDMWPGLYLWGYPFTALAVAALAAGLLAYERDRGDGRVRPWAPLLGLTCAWLQPWQGATFIVIVLASEAIVRLARFSGSGRRSLAPMIATVAATAAPLCYYAVLARTDPSWAIAQDANAIEPWPAWTLLASIGPLALPALLAYRLSARTFQEIAVRAWPIVALALYWFIALTGIGTFPLHSLQGLSLPFAVLAVKGASVLSLRRASAIGIGLATIAVAVLMLPALVRELDRGRDGIEQATEPYFISPSEHGALRHLENERFGGGVLAPVYLGQAIPAQTGRRTWVGLLSWTPGFEQRRVLAEQLFTGQTSPARARRLVRATGARFLLADCRGRTDLTAALRPILASTRRFGCATVYEVRDGLLTTRQRD